MAKIDKTTIVDTSQDDSLSWVKSGNNITLGPYPDKTYVDKKTEIINEPGGNIDDVQINAGGKFAGDNGLTFNRTTDQLNVKGNLNVGGYIKGKIITNRFNLFITGGSDGQVLSTDGTGNLTWVDQSGGGSGTNYSNANVASYLPTFTGNLAGGNLVITSGVYTYDISSTGTASLTTLNVNAQSRLGSVSNVKITGGSANYVLKTDGAGNLSWTAPQAGPAGPAGAAGTSATITVGNVTTGAAGTSVIITNSGNSTTAVFDFTIPKGDHGETGPQGDTGPKGDTGDTGPQGPPGATGPTGATGATGAQGVPGNDGATGATGPAGPAGATGATGPKGDKGDQGIQGSTGAQGEPGPKGDKGDTGDQGVSVTLIGSVPSSADLPTPGGLGEGYITSDTGNLWFWNSVTTSWNDIGKIVGPQGDPGPQGPTGAQGAQGDQGPAGNDGATGPTGPEGPQGATGATGPKGDTGDQGPAGNDGLDGTSFVWQSEWNGGYYVPNDVVYYQGSAYICIVDNNNTEPTNTTYWELMTAKGDQGLQGDQGVMGPRGYGVNPGGVTGQVLVKSSDTDYDTVWQDPTETTIHIGDNAPSTAIDGTVWWSSEAGRSYIKYNDQWVDMSPQTSINPEIQANSITFEDGTIQTTAYTGSSNVSVNKLVNGNYEATLENDGTLTIPGLIHLNYANGEVGFIQTTSHGVALSGAYDKSVAITTDGANGTKSWEFNTSGNIVFPDGTEQNTAYTGQTTDNTILINDNVPSSAPEGTLWFKSDAGRTYVKYSNTWVDASPQTIDSKALRANDDNLVELPDGGELGNAQRIHENNPNGKKGVDLYASTQERWVQLNYNEDQYIWADEDKAYIEVGSNTPGVDSKTWEFDKQGNIRFPDNTIQTTAYQPATLLDGGSANANYAGNIAPGGISNPFDQDLNTSDNVLFLNVTANNFNGTATLANSAISVPVGNITGLGNLATINITGSSSTVLYGNGVFAPVSGSSTGNVTFNNVTIQGVSGYSGGLQFSASPEDTANLKYLQIRSGDTDSHIHFDTGNNNAYDQYFGDDFKYLKLEAGLAGNVKIGTFQDGGIGQLYWTFDSNGNLTLPTNYSAINYANGSPYGSNTTTDNFFINGEDRGLVVDAAGLKRFGFMKYSGIEGSLVHSTNVGAAVPLRIGRTSTADVTLGNINTFTTEIYVGTNGHVRIADDTVNDINDPTERLEVVGNIKANNIGNISALNLDGNSANVLYGNGVFAAPAASSSYSNSNVVTFLSSFGSNTITTTGKITGDGGGLSNVPYANVTGLGNIVTINLDGNSANILYGNGVFAAPAPSSSYSNSNVAAYLVDNPQPGTYSNTNVSSYLTANPPTGTYSNTNVASYLTANPPTGTYSNSNVVTLLASFGSNIISTTGNANVGNINAGNAVLTGTSITGVNSVLAGPTFTPLANTMAGFVSNVNSYTQLTIQNKSTGTDATTDFVATADNGSDTVNYLDIGIINSGYDNNTPTNSLGNIVYAADSYIYAQGNASATSQSGGNLAIGTTVAGKTVKFFAGGTASSNIVATIANTGATITGNLTVSGNVQGSTPNVTLVAGSFSSVFDNTGNVTLPGNLTVNGSFGIKTPNLPAFRVYGTVSTNIVAGNTITSTNGATVDYNQGSYYNNTTGLFTAPIAGLYHCYGTIRLGNFNGMNQAAIQKNASLGGANVIGFFETDTNTGTLIHGSLSGYAKCNVGDTIRLQVVAGNLQFDSNDSWGVTYIG